MKCRALKVLKGIARGCASDGAAVRNSAAASAVTAAAAYRVRTSRSHTRPRRTRLLSLENSRHLTGKSSFTSTRQAWSSGPSTSSPPRHLRLPSSLAPSLLPLDRRCLLGRGLLPRCALGLLGLDELVLCDVARVRVARRVVCAVAVVVGEVVLDLGARRCGATRVSALRISERDGAACGLREREERERERQEGARDAQRPPRGRARRPAARVSWPLRGRPRACGTGSGGPARCTCKRSGDAPSAEDEALTRKRGEEESEGRTCA